MPAFLVALFALTVLTAERSSAMQPKETQNSAIPMLELYQSYDGIVAGATRVRVKTTGEWELDNYGSPKSSKQGANPHGALSPESLHELQNFLNEWKGRVQPNGWSEPHYGGCTDPIEMAAVRFREGEVHYQYKLINASLPINREEIQTLIGKVKTLIPEIKRYNPFRDSTSTK